MKVSDAKAMISALSAAVALAEQEGRETLLASDIDPFVAADDEARRLLVEAIEGAGA